MVDLSLGVVLEVVCDKQEPPEGPPDQFSSGGAEERRYWPYGVDVREVRFRVIPGVPHATLTANRRQENGAAGEDLCTSVTPT